MHRIYNILTGKWEATLQANDSRNRHEISMMEPGLLNYNYSYWKKIPST